MARWRLGSLAGGRVRSALTVAGWSVAAAWLLAMIGLLVRAHNPAQEDFGIFYNAAATLRFAPHADIYDTHVLLATYGSFGGCSSAVFYPYQPLFALLLEPLTLLPCATASTLWLAFNIALWLGLTAWLVARSWRQFGQTRAVVVALACALYLPIASGIIFGQVHLILLACFVASLTLLERREATGRVADEWWAGVVLGVGAALKYYPAFLLFYLLLCGRWRAVAGGALAALALTLVEWRIVGTDTMLASVQGANGNVSYAAALYQDGNWVRALPFGVLDTPLAYGAVAVFVGVILGVALLRRKGDLLLGAAWALPTMLLLAPLVWWSYMTWLLPAILICFSAGLRVARSQRRWSYAPLAALALVYGALLIPQYGTGAEHYRAQAVGTLLLWLCCLVLYLWSARGAAQAMGAARHVALSSAAAVESA